MGLVRGQGDWGTDLLRNHGRTPVDDSEKRRESWRVYGRGKYLVVGGGRSLTPEDVPLLLKVSASAWWSVVMRPCRRMMSHAGLLMVATSQVRHRVLHEWDHIQNHAGPVLAEGLALSVGSQWKGLEASVVS